MRENNSGVKIKIDNLLRQREQIDYSCSNRSQWVNQKGQDKEFDVMNAK